MQLLRYLLAKWRQVFLLRKLSARLRSPPGQQIQPIKTLPIWTVHYYQATFMNTFCTKTKWFSRSVVKLCSNIPISAWALRYPPCLKTTPSGAFCPSLRDDVVALSGMYSAATCTSGSAMLASDGKLGSANFSLWMNPWNKRADCKLRWIEQVPFASPLTLLWNSTSDGGERWWSLLCFR